MIPLGLAGFFVVGALMVGFGLGVFQGAREQAAPDEGPDMSDLRCDATQHFVGHVDCYTPQRAVEL